jgi:hypothetical protein
MHILEETIKRMASCSRVVMCSFTFDDSQWITLIDECRKLKDKHCPFNLIDKDIIELYIDSDHVERIMCSLNDQCGFIIFFKEFIS